MSERDYLIAKAQRSVDPHGAGAPGVGSFLLGPPGAAGAAAIQAPKGKKARSAAAAGGGAALGMVPGVALMAHGANAYNKTSGASGLRRVVGGRLGAIAGGIGGAQAGYYAINRKKKGNRY